MASQSTCLLLSGAAFLACNGAAQTRAANSSTPQIAAEAGAVASSDASASALAERRDDGGSPAAIGPTTLTFKAVNLPHATAPASLDYIAYEAAQERVWIPVGDAGAVDVFDIASGRFAVVTGFGTAERDYHGKKRTLGPNAVTIGDGFAYVGNRATGEVCAVDRTSLEKKPCLKLSSPTDGVAFVASAKEVWVTTPRAQSIAVLDASQPGALKMKTTIKLDGAPEGYAMDESRGVFFTNLEDRNSTVVIDIASHRPRTAWRLDCGSSGPRGVAADVARGFVYVACTDRVVVLDGAHDGATLATIEIGGGIDNIDWFSLRRLLYAAAGQAEKEAIVRIDDEGQPAWVATGALPGGARNGVADSHGNAYVTDPVHGRLLVIAYAP